MKGSPPPIPSTSSAGATAGSCPGCQSSFIVTTAKIPDADSYWRCMKCGDVWNVARSRGARSSGRDDWMRRRTSY
jgi:predicted Zn finger-like uncharacterized protein